MRDRVYDTWSRQCRCQTRQSSQVLVRIDSEAEGNELQVVKMGVQEQE